MDDSSHSTLLNSPAEFLWKHRWSLEDDSRVNQEVIPIEVFMPNVPSLLERLTWPQAYG